MKYYGEFDIITKTKKIKKGDRDVDGSPRYTDLDLTTTTTKTKTTTTTIIALGNYFRKKKILLCVR